MHRTTVARHPIPPQDNHHQYLFATAPTTAAAAHHPSNHINECHPPLPPPRHTSCTRSHVCPSSSGCLRPGDRTLLHVPESAGPHTMRKPLCRILPFLLLFLIFGLDLVCVVPSADQDHSIVFQTVGGVLSRHPISKLV